MADRPGEPARSRTARSLALLAGRQFRLLWMGQTVSAAGDALIPVALVFAVLHIHGSAADIGYIAAIQTVTRLTFILTGGVWADRMHRQLVMLTSDAVRAVVYLAMGVLLVTGRAQVWQLGVGAAISGSAQAFFGPACAGLVPQTVAAEQLQQANALMSFSASVCQVAGFGVAGLLVAALGPGPVFVVDAATFVVSAVSLGLLRLPARSFTPRKPFLRDLALGWHEVAIRPWYWLNLIAHALWNAGIAAYFVLGPVIAATSLGGAAAWGTISAARALGAVAGGIIALRARPRRPLVAGNLSLLLTMLALLALVPPLPVWQIAVATAIGGAATVFLNTVWLATMQALIPDEVRSRVNSYDWLLSQVVQPAAYAAVGPVAAAFGTPSTLVAAALVLGVPSAITVLIPGVRAIRKAPDGRVTGPPVRGAAHPPGGGSRPAATAARQPGTP